MRCDSAWYSAAIAASSRTALSMTAGSRVRARLTCCEERVAVARQRIVADERPVGDGGAQVVLQPVDRNRAAQLQADRRPRRRALQRSRERIAQLETRSAGATPLARRRVGRVARIEQRQRDAVRLVDERRVARQRAGRCGASSASAAARRSPSAAAPCARTPAPRPRTTSCAASRNRCCSAAQVAVHRELVARGIDDADVDRASARATRPPSSVAAGGASPSRRSGTRATRRSATRAPRAARSRNAGDRLGQSGSADCAMPWAAPSGHVRDLFTDHARHEPRQRRRVDLVELRERYGQRQSIERVTGREPVLRAGESAPATCSVSGNSASVTESRRVAHQRVARQEEPARMRALVDTGASARTTRARRRRRERARHRTRRSPTSSTSTSSRRALCSSSAISAISARLCRANGASTPSASATSASRMNTSRASRGAIAPYATRPARDQREPVELHALARDDVAASLVPVRVEMVARHAVARDGLDPFGLDAAGAAREQPRRLRELRGEHPFRRLLREPRARVQEEADAARAVVLAAHRRGGLGLHADVAEQSGEQRAMDRRVARRHRSSRATSDRASTPLPPAPRSAARARRAIRSCAGKTRNARDTRRRACDATAPSAPDCRRIPTTRSATGNRSAVAIGGWLSLQDDELKENEKPIFKSRRTSLCVRLSLNRRRVLLNMPRM